MTTQDLVNSSSCQDSWSAVLMELTSHSKSTWNVYRHRHLPALTWSSRRPCTEDGLTDGSKAFRLSRVDPTEAVASTEAEGTCAQRVRGSRWHGQTRSLTSMEPIPPTLKPLRHVSRVEACQTTVVPWEQSAWPNSGTRHLACCINASSDAFWFWGWASGCLLFI